MLRSLATVAALAVLLTAACAAPPRQSAIAPPARPPAAPAPIVTPQLTSPPRAVLMALGDSVPAGTRCGCAPYPELSAAAASARGHRRVDAIDDAVPGFGSRDVLRQLDDDTHVIADVRRADMVLVEVGANDVQYATACGTDAACYEAILPTVESNLDAIVARIRAIATRPVDVVMLDYWSAWLGGRYERAQGPSYVDAAERVTQSLNASISRVAAADGATAVGLRGAFRGPDGSRDETGLLASDGDHPNAAGHRRIAQAIAAATGWS